MVLYCIHNRGQVTLGPSVFDPTSIDLGPLRVKFSKTEFP